MLMTNEADKKQPYVGNRKHLEFLLIQKWSKSQDSISEFTRSWTNVFSNKTFYTDILKNFLYLF